MKVVILRNVGKSNKVIHEGREVDLGIDQAELPKFTEGSKHTVSAELGHRLIACKLAVEDSDEGGLRDMAPVPEHAVVSPPAPNVFSAPEPKESHRAGDRAGDKPGDKK